MKKSRFVYGTALALGLLFTTVGCGGNSGGGSAPVVVSFNYDLYLETPASENILYKNEGNKILIAAVGDTEGREYTFALANASHSQYLTVDDEGNIMPIKDSGAVNVAVRVTEKKSKKKKELSFKIRDSRAQPISDGANYSGSPEQRLQILGELEKFAVNTHLTGLTLFENGGFVRYANKNDPSQGRTDSRVVHLPTEEYITGFGFGLLSDGWITGTLGGGSTAHPDYFHTYSSSDPLDINAWDAQGSQVSDLNGYITSSYWGIRLKNTEETEWYPILARDHATEPEPLDTDGNVSGLYRKWRIYVKTGTEETPENERIYYRTMSGDAFTSQYDGTPVKLEDYVFLYKLLFAQSSDMFRGAEAAGDTTYGIRGAQDFYTKTEGMSAADIDELWDEYTKVNPQTGKKKLGIGWGVDSEKGSYIDLEILNSIDAFTAMYTLSSNLYSPLPESFLAHLGGGDYAAGATKYGRFGKNGESILNNVLCVGSHVLENWVDTTEIVFKTNDQWFEYGKPGIKGPDHPKYSIPGVYMRIYTGATSQEDLIYSLFKDSQALDSTGIPQKKMNEKLDTDLETKGNSTFKLNVNSCDRDMWNYLFGDSGVIVKGKDDSYDLKPWMANHNFIDGISFSINRKKFADARGVQPSVNYFSDAYMSDPKQGISYNGTDEHKAAIAKYNGTNYGYSEANAISSFKIAVEQLVKGGKLSYGTSTNPTPISIKIMWMYQSDVTSYGTEIVGYIEKAFNDPEVCGGRVKLTVEQDYVQVWQDVYDKYLMVGKYDLGFGAISGNTYNPLNFMEVLKSDNSSNFTLNWGTNTNEIDNSNPIVFDGKSWTFDALWAAGDHGTLAEEGKAVKAVKECYLNNPIPTTEGANPDHVYLGCEIEVPTTFVDIQPTEEFPDDGFVITQISLYIFNIGAYEFSGEDLKRRENGTYYIVLTAETAEEINDKIVKKFELDEAAKKPGLTPEQIDALLHPLTYSNYNIFWNVDVYYTSTIKGVVTENLETAKKTKADVQRFLIQGSLAHM